MNMPGLWADGWFVIAAAGLAVSVVLFFVLLGQYRAASSAADEARAPEPEPAPVRPVYIPDEPEAPAAEEPAPAPHPAAEEKPAPAPAAPARKSPETTTGGISPAVVYLQSIKNQLEELQKTTRALAARVDGVASRDEALIERLGELAAAVAALKAPAASASSDEAPPPAAKKAQKAAASPAPAVSLQPPEQPPPAPKTEPLPEPAPKEEPSPDETVRLELGKLIDGRLAEKTEPAEPSPADAPVQGAEGGDTPRRGPVWPV
jgi:hypothetical protein